ncbi:MAG: hypothetical protein U5L09_15625 [Bacteroidales bacterium]|nr:hypothetical protein [Bacteroidales bacterium]
MPKDETSSGLFPVSVTSVTYFPLSGKNTLQAAQIVQLSSSALPFAHYRQIGLASIKPSGISTCFSVKKLYKRTTAKKEDNMFIQHYHDTLKNNKLIWSGGKGGDIFSTKVWRKGIRFFVADVYNEFLCYGLQQENLIGQPL